MKRGATLLEMLVGVSLLGTMMAAVLMVYVMGGRMLSKGNAQTELLADLQTATTGLSAALQRSAYDGLTVELYSLACLTATDAQGKVAVEDGQLRWNRYLVYYRDPVRQALMRREVPASPPPIPLAALSTYLNGGRLMARHISALGFRAEGRLVHIRVQGEFRERTIAQQVTVRVRN